MKKNSTFDIREPKLKPAALLWDESFLWGILAYKALDACGLPYQFIRADDIKRGRLAEYALLFVPGGWASNKVKALGDDGVEAIRQFVRSGGHYLGFCGGAGLATEDGIGLLPVKRRPTRERVPSFSGRIRLKTSDHPLWKGISDPTFHAWWPSQFVAGEGASVLAAYGDAMPDAFSSDVNVGDAEKGDGWAELERAYQINLDPKRLMDEPAVIEGRFGMGKVLLSLLHFDTPNDRNGAIVLGNIWKYLIPNAEHQKRALFGSGNEVQRNNVVMPELEKAVTALIELGQRNFLWFWRNPQLLQWRRGVRGLEYCTLYVLVHELSNLTKQQGHPGASDLEKGLQRTRELLLPFVDKAKELLVRERFAMQKGQITYERCDDPEVQALRDELFSRAKSYGGSFKELLDEIDSLLYGLLLSRKQPIQVRNDR
jgi:putative intracellular protease/amidase